MSGVEYGITLANINDYLLHLGAAQKSIGYAFTFFAFAGLITSPIYGHLCDRIGSVKLPLLSAMAFSITGSLTMSLGRNLNMLYLGRFLMGFGWGIDGPIVGKVALLRPEDTGLYIPVLLVMRQVGIILGPLLIFWTKTWSFDLVGIKIDEFNSATLLVAFMWSIVLTLNLIATHYEPKPISSKDKKENGEMETLTTTDSQKYVQVSPLPPLTEQIVICLVLSLSAYILQSTLESMVTPLTRRLMGWDQTENAYFFMTVGILAVLGYLCVSALAKKLVPRTTLLIGAGVELVVVLLLTLFLPLANFREWWLIPWFICMTAIFIFALPFIVVSSATLMSLFTDESAQSTIQGIRVAAERVAQICGPLWGGEVLHNYYLVFLFPAVFLTLSIALLVSSWSWMDARKFRKGELQSNNNNATEQLIVKQAI